MVTNKRIMLLHVDHGEKSHVVLFITIHFLLVDHLFASSSKLRMIWTKSQPSYVGCALGRVAGIRVGKARRPQSTHLILHLKNFKRSEPFARVIKCKPEEDLDSGDPQAVEICSAVWKMLKTYEFNMKSLTLKVVPNADEAMFFRYLRARDMCTSLGMEADRREMQSQNKAFIMLRKISSSSSSSNERRFVEHIINFDKIWRSELEFKRRCTLCKKKALEDDGICNICRPVCPPGYICVGDVAHVGTHPPNVAAVYQFNEKTFALPIGFDLVWRNCPDDYLTPVSIWLPRAPEGFVSLGRVAVA